MDTMLKPGALLLGKRLAVEELPVAELWVELMLMLVPIWVAILAGLILGWSWRPRWVSLLFVALRSRPRLAWSVPPGFGARRLWLAATAAAAAPWVRDAGQKIVTWVSVLSERWRKMKAQMVALQAEAASCLPAGRLTLRAKRVILEERLERQRELAETSAQALQAQADHALSPARAEIAASTAHEVKGGFQRVDSASFDSQDGLQLSLLSSSAEQSEGDNDSDAESPTPPLSSSHLAHLVTDDDLEEFSSKLEEQDGGPMWSLLMEKSTTGMKYYAWRRDPKSGPTEYRSRTVVENCSPETMRDFFWDDDFRPYWDDMLVQWRTLDECHLSGVQIVQWVRKFPFFCKDREYVIGRRIWSHAGTYYCITKGVSHPDVPPKDKPRRVDIFYSSWRIRSVEGGACEVMLFHHEEMGIQRDLAKLGVRQGMWAAVRKIEPGVRRFQKQYGGESTMPISRSVSMARLHTPIMPLMPSSSDEEGGGCGTGSQGMKRRWVSSCDLMRQQRTPSMSSLIGSRGEESPRQKQSLLAQQKRRGVPLDSGTSSTASSSFDSLEAAAALETSLVENVPQTGSAAASAIVPARPVLLSCVGRLPSPEGRPSSLNPLAGVPEVGCSEKQRMQQWSGRTGNESEVAAGRRGRKIRWAIAAGSVVALLWGVEAGILMKFFVAGLAKRAIQQAPNEAREKDKRDQ